MEESRRGREGDVNVINRVVEGHDAATTWQGKWPVQRLWVSSACVFKED